VRWERSIAVPILAIFDRKSFDLGK